VSKNLQTCLKRTGSAFSEKHPQAAKTTKETTKKGGRTLKKELHAKDPNISGPLGVVRKSLKKGGNQSRRYLKGKWLNYYEPDFHKRKRGVEIKKGSKKKKKKKETGGTKPMEVSSPGRRNKGIH